METVRDIYKVVRPQGDKLVSAWMSLNDWKCEYVQDQRTEPRHKGSYLFAFISLEGAQAFAYDAYTQIWLASGEGSRKAPYWLPVVDQGLDLDRYWRLAHTRGLVRVERVPVLGSFAPHLYVPGDIQNSSVAEVLCQAITLKERVA